MPYKNEADRIANKILYWRFKKQLPYWRSIGLEPVNLNDFREGLRCTNCGKISKLNTRHKARHEAGCVGIKLAESTPHFRNGR